MQVKKLLVAVGEAEILDREATIFCCSVNAGHSKEGGGRCGHPFKAWLALKANLGS